MSMTLSQLKRYVEPATVEIDSSGCIEIIAPDGFCFEHTLHILVLDPQMCRDDKTGDLLSIGKLYQDAAKDFDGFTLQSCADTCSCKEEI